MSTVLRHWALRAIVLSSLPLMTVSCSQDSGVQAGNASNPLVTDVAHSVVKRQSIGNCWLYAQATWLESLMISATGEAIDVSESYWTWWHWYDQIVASSITDVSTGGWWSTSANIALMRGYVLEGEFIAEETDAEMSARQASALAYINTQLKPGGKLAKRIQRTPARVRAELDKAYGVKMKTAEAIARPAATTKVKADGTTLAQALAGNGAKRWMTTSFPRTYGEDAPLPQATAAARKALLKRVMRALNDRHPVVMTLMIDFNALDTADATFKKALVDELGVGTQGGHMVVLEDYKVANVPVYGTLDYGDLSAAEKAAAVDGDVLELKAKNSWGKNRLDRGLIDGYTAFDAAYLFQNLEWKNASDETVTYHYTTLTDFVLPPGY